MAYISIFKSNTPYIFHALFKSSLALPFLKRDPLRMHKDYLKDTTAPEHT
jgi:hypothetical protein